MKKTALTLLALVFVATGCVDQGSPEATVKSLGYTLVKNKYKAFRGILMGDALTQLGSQEVFDDLRKDAEIFKSAKVEKATTISEADKGNDRTYSVHEVSIFKADGEILGVATVDCVTSYGYSAIYPDQIKGQTLPAALHGARGAGEADVPDFDRSSPEWHTGCQISALDFN